MESDGSERELSTSTILVSLLGISLLVVSLSVGAVVTGGVLGDAGVAPPATDGTPTPSGGNTNLSFRPVSGEVGFNYTYASEVTFQGRRKLATNAGVYVSDINDDGWPDLLAIGGRSPALFVNTGGEFRRSDRLPPLDAPVSSALFLDYDVDGSEDLLLFTTKGDAVLLENENGSFIRRDTRLDRWLSEPIGATTADYDGDGCPDLFVIQHGNWSRHVPLGFRNYSAPVNDDNAKPNRMFEGTCSGFALTNTSAVRGSRWSMATSSVDLNGDSRPDIHVANDFNHDIVYLNRGNGTFEQVVLGENTNRNGMASEVFDVNRDGSPDVFVTNIFYPDMVETAEKAAGNNMLVNRGNGTFADRVEQYGVPQGGWGWAAVAADLDNDGDQDMVHATQTLRFGSELTSKEVTILHAKYPIYRYPAVWTRTGGAFEPSAPSRVGFEPMDSRGMARLDYNRDGDLDLLFATRSRYRLYENLDDEGHAIEIVVRGGENASALGATVRVVTDDREHTRFVAARSDFLSQDSRTVHVGVGNDTRVDVQVVWPDGTEQTFRDVRVGQLLVVTPEGIETSVELPRNGTNSDGG